MKKGGVYYIENKAMKINSFRVCVEDISKNNLKMYILSPNDFDDSFLVNNIWTMSETRLKCNFKVNYIGSKEELPELFL
jgi:hypothetical protein